MLDPGIDLAKTPAESVELLRRLPELEPSGPPAAAGRSRARTSSAPSPGARPPSRERGHAGGARGAASRAARRSCGCTTWPPRRTTCACAARCRARSAVPDDLRLDERPAPGARGVSAVHDRPDLRPPLRLAALRAEPARARDRRGQRARAGRGDRVRRPDRRRPARRVRVGARLPRPDRVRAHDRDPRQPRLAQRRLRALRGAVRRAPLRAAPGRRLDRGGGLHRARPRPRRDRPRAATSGSRSASPPRRPTCASSCCTTTCCRCPGTGRERNVVHDAGDTLECLQRADVHLVLSGPQARALRVAAREPVRGQRRHRLDHAPARQDQALLQRDRGDAASGSRSTASTRSTRATRSSRSTRAPTSTRRTSRCWARRRTGSSGAGRSPWSTESTTPPPSATRSTPSTPSAALAGVVFCGGEEKLGSGSLERPLRAARPGTTPRRRCASWRARRTPSWTWPTSRCCPAGAKLELASLALHLGPARSRRPGARLDPPRYERGRLRRARSWP